MKNDLSDEPNIEKTEVTIEDEAKTRKNIITIEGPQTDLAKFPEKVYQLMDLLDLPKGSKALIKTTVGSVIVR